ncbi:hypothetical protein BH11MYX3_BH11MYX3_48960 [soil metagenome]
MPSLVMPLFEGPLDLVGDIHGELEALLNLFAALGYTAQGEHPAGRRLIFLGDLCDRGTDSPAVIELVRGLVDRGLAQCILGNHELNLVRNDSKEGNRWYLDPSHEEQTTDFAHSKPAPAELKDVWQAFFLSLPLALERADLRVVHAAWHAPSIEIVRAADDMLAVYNHWDRIAKARFDGGLAAAAAAEKAAHDLHDRSTPVPFLPRLAERDELVQMGNPVRILTSGIERQVTEPFWATGKWRMCERVKWWDDYDGAPVIVGHYWRSAGSDADRQVSGGKPDLFAPRAPNEWVGTAGRVFCVDYSVGGRYVERKAGTTPFVTRLAAVRWPEQEVVFDDGAVLPMVSSATP